MKNCKRKSDIQAKSSRKAKGTSKPKAHSGNILFQLKHDDNFLAYLTDRISPDQVGEKIIMQPSFPDVTSNDRFSAIFHVICRVRSQPSDYEGTEKVFDYVATKIASVLSERKLAHFTYHESGTEDMLFSGGRKFVGKVAMFHSANHVRETYDVIIDVLNQLNIAECSMILVDFLLPSSTGLCITDTMSVYP